jgi:hypothetical protein
VTVNIEDASWDENSHRQRGKGLSQSVKALRDLKIGDCKRIYHYDVSCKRTPEGNDYACSLRAAAIKLGKTTAKLFETYHEEVSVLVVRRVK